MVNKVLLVFALIVIGAGITQASEVSETIALSDYVVDFEYDDSDVKSGETFRLAATVTNEAGETRNNIVISLDPDSPFDTVGDDAKNLGELEDGESKTVTFRIEVDEDVASDEYALDFEIKDNEDEDSDELSIDVESDKVELIIGNVESLPTIISPDLDDVKLTLTIENTEDEDADFVRARLVLPEGFSPSGSYSDIANLGTIGAKESKEVEFFIDTSMRIPSGNNKGVLELEYDEDGSARTSRLEFDLPVKGRPQFLITKSNTEPGVLVGNSEAELFITIENVGEEDGEETSIRVFENSDQPFEFEEKTNFIGDLSPRESGTASLKFTVDSDAIEKTYLMRIQVRTVSGGNVLVEEMSLPVKVSVPQRGNAIYWIIGIAIVLLGALIFFVIRMTRR